MIHLLVTTDFSKQSRKALRHALKMARQLKNVSITVANVLEYNVPYSLYGYGGLPIAPDMKEIEEQMKHFLGTLSRRVSSMVVRAQTVPQGILKAARSCHADYIVISSHGRGAAGSLFLGSVTQKLISKTRTPIVVVHA